MSSEGTAPERRLHPLSFGFLLAEHLKTLLLPLLVLLVTGRRNDNELYALVGVVGVAIYSIAQYFTYRYRIEGDAIVVRSGVFQRNLRHVPFARIQNVALHQNLLHRLFGVAEVSLESAGSSKPEAHMRVLRLRDAQELERQVRRGGPREAAVASVDAEGLPAPTPVVERELLTLSTPEVLRLGLASNRGMLIVGGALAALAQVGDNLIGKAFAALGAWLGGHAASLHLSFLWSAVAVAVLFLVAAAGLRVLSTIWALLQFHGFRLSEADGRLSVQRGLFTRVRATVPRHRIQAWSLHEGLVQRWLGRRSLRVDSPVVESGHGDKHALKDLAPIATPVRIDALIDGLLPRHGWPMRAWQPLHARAWRRKFTVPALLLVLLTVLAAWWRGAQALWLLALLPLLALRGWWWARNAAWAMADGLVAFRGGWLSRYWRFAEVRKLQALELVQSPFDRRLGMATLHFDTAGADGNEPPLEIPYLPEATAQQLYAELSAQLA